MRYRAWNLAWLGLMTAACVDNPIGTSPTDDAVRSASPDLRPAILACGAAPPPNLAPTPSCSTPESFDGFEPPCNPHLAQNGWSSSHRASFAQASSPFRGIESNDQVHIDHRPLLAAPNNINFTEPDAAGRVAAWSSTVGFTGEIVKFDFATMRELGRFVPEGGGTLSASGAYNLLDRDQRLVVGQGGSLQVFGDQEDGNRHSGIALLKEFPLPAQARCGSRDDELVGITMLFDGNIAFATKLGMVGVVPRQPAAMCDANVRVFSINGDRCNDPTIPDDQLEQVSNSIAADEGNRVFVVTSQAQHRIDWDGSELTAGWRAPYAGAGGTGAGRLGAGSGSTPTVMGGPKDLDRFIVITDGQPLMHLVLLWKDQIPDDWQPIKPGRDRRIACEIPVTFGNPNATVSLSEQSVLVRGYAAMVVNNQVALNDLLGAVPAQLQPFTQLLSGVSINRPRGLERIDWDPATRTCRSVWSNTDVSIPNAIPSMSSASGLIYGIGSRTINLVDSWTLEAIDFKTGKSAFHIASSAYPTDNSFYAATVIAPDRSIWTGTFGGMTRFVPCRDGETCGRRPSPLEHLPPIR